MSQHEFFGDCFKVGFCQAAAPIAYPDTATLCPYSLAVPSALCPSVPLSLSPPVSPPERSVGQAGKSEKASDFSTRAPLHRHRKRGKTTRELGHPAPAEQMEAQMLASRPWLREKQEEVLLSVNKKMQEKAASTSSPKCSCAVHPHRFLMLEL